MFSNIIEKSQGSHHQLIRITDKNNNPLLILFAYCFFQTAQVSEICEKLCSLIIDGKDALRDIYSIGLKTLIQDVPDEMGIVVADKLASRLLNGISRETTGEDTKKECLDNMVSMILAIFI